MTREELFEEIKKKRSFLCVGLDTDIDKVPSHLLKEEDPVFEFNKQIIDATKDLCIAYKPNIAFYECRGVVGWESLRKTLEYIPKEIFTIADAKRGDIGNTSLMYARTFFQPESSGLDFDSVTVAPYMGIDSVAPFLGFEGKWAIVLALTSNEGNKDFQYLETEDDFLFEKVITTSREWAGPDRLMYVVGATQPDAFADVRKLAPDHFLLVPGIGAQGGNLSEIAECGLNGQCGLIVNSSRGIIYASGAEDFADKARMQAKKLQEEMQHLLEKM
ncbi:orotidine-5'-phosphate decarboxylase [Anseongella ginsenosidimutans]|uniref:Orotidine-5'-phosphate decarboxylase n=1 Tax=Anseongella ginsenosidimutans TaxID=496056 RepID=A0A4R3KP15_9SPHI|nr:orotidine-5'-phosphate decarboxylase [Anseongella ginsenosidimutans]QEC53703.1 orotidine-5'-phosphate decarboxylase [Anseongella ginsenosidimutans]TCS86047.1 orotidine-5'-phosphate decarboxylase [Anseongella ginsenosidimutans]